MHPSFDLVVGPNSTSLFKIRPVHSVGSRNVSLHRVLLPRGVRRRIVIEGWNLPVVAKDREGDGETPEEGFRRPRPGGTRTELRPEIPEVLPPDQWLQWGWWIFVDYRIGRASGQP